MTPDLINRVGAFALVCLLAVPLSAASQSLSDLSLEDLMQIDAGQVFGASERLQPAIEAPASVSFITAQEIHRYGYRTLADILRSVRGIYVTNDRNFSFVGARGFGKPGDYNSRILLLINGHRVNDNVFGQAEIGAEFGLDPATFERVEIIRGPGLVALRRQRVLRGGQRDHPVGRVARRHRDDRRDRHAGHAAGARQHRTAAVERTRLRAVDHLRAQRRRRPAVLPRVRHAGDEQRHRRGARRRRASSSSTAG